MAHTKKVGSTGRWGARYGLMLRKRTLEVERIQKCKQKCPFCLKFTLKRLAAGIWFCKHCKVKFAGKAYEPGVTGKDMLNLTEVKPEEIEEKKVEVKQKV